MNAGKMDKFVVVERNTPTVGSLHEPVDSWATHISIWCEEMTPSAKEIREGQDIQHNTVQLKSWPCDVTHKDRILYNSNYYHIESVIDKKSYYLINATMNQQ